MTLQRNPQTRPSRRLYVFSAITLIGCAPALYATLTEPFDGSTLRFTWRIYSLLAMIAMASSYWLTGRLRNAVMVTGLGSGLLSMCLMLVYLLRR